MLNEISILCSADETYARQCAVMMLSVLSNTAEAKRVHFYLLSPDFSAESRTKLKKVCDLFGAEISILPIDLQQFKSLPIHYKHTNLLVYSRLIAPDICKMCDQLIYLDCDLIVLGDVAELYNFDLSGKPLGAVPHVSLPYQQVFTATFPVGGIDRYFNAGVLVINAKFWRNNCLTEKILDLVDTYSNDLEFADQDLLNIYFWRNYSHLPGTWNVEARLYREKILGLSQDAEIKERMRSPKLIHYTGSDKPWSSSKYVPKREFYIEYSDRLSVLIDWDADSIIRKMNILKGLSFAYSCMHFRAASFLKILRQKFNLACL